MDIVHSQNLMAVYPFVVGDYEMSSDGYRIPWSLEVIIAAVGAVTGHKH